MKEQAMSMRRQEGLGLEGTLAGRRGFWRRGRRGQNLMEMVLVIGAVAITGMVAWAVASAKVSDAVAIGASSLPGSHPGDNGSITSALFMELELNDPAAIKLDSAQITTNLGTNRFGEAMGDATVSTSVTPGPSINGGN